MNSVWFLRTWLWRFLLGFKKIWRKQLRSCQDIYRHRWYCFICLYLVINIIIYLLFWNRLYKLTSVPSSLFSIPNICSSWTISSSSPGCLGGLIFNLLRLEGVGAIRVLEDARFLSTFSLLLVGFFHRPGRHNWFYWDTLKPAQLLFFIWIYLFQLLVCARLATLLLVGYPPPSRA